MLGESVSMKFEYDYSSLFSPDKLKIDYIPSADGEYIYDAASGSYENMILPIRHMQAWTGIKSRMFHWIPGESRWNSIWMNISGIRFWEMWQRLPGWIWSVRPQNTALREMPMTIRP